MPSCAWRWSSASERWTVCGAWLVLRAHTMLPTLLRRFSTASNRGGPQALQPCKPDWLPCPSSDKNTPHGPLQRRYFQRVHGRSLAEMAAPMSTGDIIAADVKASRIAELVKQNKAVNLALEREKVHRPSCFLRRRCVPLVVELGPTSRAVQCGLWALFLRAAVLRYTVRAGRWYPRSPFCHASFTLAALAPAPNSTELTEAWWAA